MHCALFSKKFTFELSLCCFVLNSEHVFLSFPQTQREVEAKRKEEEKQEREKQQTIQRDLERQLEEAKEVRQREVYFIFRFP